MSLRPKELAEVAAELRERLAGAVVQKVFVPDPVHTYLEVRLPGRSHLLCVSVTPKAGRVSLVGHRPPSPKQALAFQGKLRREAVGARLGTALLVGQRRIAIELQGHEQRHWLVADWGSAGLIAWCDGLGRVLACTGPAAVRGGERLSLEPASPPEGASRLSAARGGPLPYLSSAEQLLGEGEGLRRVDELRRQLVGPLKTRLARLERTVEKVRAEASRGQEAEAHRRAGELLSQNLHLLARGARSVRLTEYTAEGEQVREVPLDPKLGPQEQVERHFHQYRRLRRGCEHAARRLEQLALEVSATRQRLVDLAEASEQSLRAQVSSPTETAARTTTRALPYREYLSAQHQRIWVGRSAKDNDALTFRLARPHHVWFHARGVPGSHVLVPLEKGQSLASEVLLDAATLALHHSDLKGELRGEVSYTEAKYVRKPKGGGLGQVLYTREKTLWVRLEPDRLTRLLSSRYI